MWVFSISQIFTNALIKKRKKNLFLELAVGYSLLNMDEDIAKAHTISSN